MPHTMKKFLFSMLLCGALFCFTSCENGYTECTPYLQFSYFLHNPYIVNDTIHSQDTLYVTAVSNGYQLDTIALGDSVCFTVGFGSAYNYLTKIHIDYDTTKVYMRAKIAATDYTTLFDTVQSDPSRMQFVPKIACNYISFPVYYTTRKKGNIDFTVVCESDSKYSPISYYIVQPCFNEDDL